MDLAIYQISTEREKTVEIIDIEGSQDRRYKSRRICHIIDSIKNQEELEALRSVYQDMLYFIGVFSPLSFREYTLVKKEGMTLPEVHNLIDRDSGEEIANGQTVRETFPNADFFIKVDSDQDKQIEIKINRFLNIIFGVEISTPTVDETAMYLASSAAVNSACLSRQVGAALTDKNGEIISVGWNDVPKAGGDLYRYSEDAGVGYDKRCMQLDGGKCFNFKEKERISKEIAKELVEEDIISEDNRQKAALKIQNSKIKDLIEFSRSIHAEMHAIIKGGQVAGHRIKDGKLFCTTYPCHSCARHIIVAGIKTVYYIEPYRKSLAIKLHADDISESEKDFDKVRILPFEGVAPNRYLSIFRMKHPRKDEKGERIEVNPKEVFPVCEVTLESLPALEGVVVKNLKRLLEKDK